MSCHLTRIELFYFDDNFCRIAQWVPPVYPHRATTSKRLWPYEVGVPFTKIILASFSKELSSKKGIPVCILRMLFEYTPPSCGTRCTRFFFFIFNSISYNTSAVFSVSRSSSRCQSEQYRLVVRKMEKYS